MVKISLLFRPHVFILYRVRLCKPHVYANQARHQAGFYSSTEEVRLNHDVFSRQRNRLFWPAGCPQGHFLAVSRGLNSDLNRETPNPSAFCTMIPVSFENNCTFLHCLFGVFKACCSNMRPGNRIYAIKLLGVHTTFVKTRSRQA